MTSGVFKSISSKDVKLHDKFYAHKSWSDTLSMQYNAWIDTDDTFNNYDNSYIDGISLCNATYETLSSGSYENEACRKYAMIDAMFFKYNSDCYATFEYIQNSVNNIYIDNQYQFGNKDIISSSDIALLNQTNKIHKVQKYPPDTKRYLQSTIKFNNPLPSEIICISIPQSKIGMHIHYGSISVIIQFTYSNTTKDITLIDNGHGELIYNNNVYGRIMYSCGIIVIYNKDIKIDDNIGQFVLTNNKTKVNWKSTVMLYQNHVLVRTKKDEFNVSQNPSLIVDEENGILNQDIVKFDAFTPYITTIGLYNDKGELLVIARLSKPIPKRNDIDINFLIKWDY